MSSFHSVSRYEELIISTACCGALIISCLIVRVSCKFLETSLSLSFSCAPDVDECLESPAVCGDGPGVCENTLGSYKCLCPAGYQGNGTHCEGSSLASGFGISM